MAFRMFETLMANFVTLSVINENPKSLKTNNYENKYVLIVYVSNIKYLINKPKKNSKVVNFPAYCKFCTLFAYLGK